MLIFIIYVCHKLLSFLPTFEVGVAGKVSWLGVCCSITVLQSLIFVEGVFFFGVCGLSYCLPFLGGT